LSDCGRDGAGEVGAGQLPTALLPPTSLNEVDRCSVEDSGWSACSQSCGVGVSARISNDNAQCVVTHHRTGAASGASLIIDDSVSSDRAAPTTRTW